MAEINKFLLLFLSLTVISATARSQDWTTPETIFEDPDQGGSFLAVAMEQNGKMHFVWGGNIHNDTIPDSLYYLQKMGLYKSKLISIYCDTTIYSISTAIDVNNNLNVVWGEGRGELSSDIENIYYSRVRNMKWMPPILVESLENLKYKPHDVKMLALPDSSLLAYWNIFVPSGTWFTYYDDGNWCRPFLPFPNYTQSVGRNGITDYPNLFKGKDGTIYVTFRGIADGEEPPPGANFMCPILYVENSPFNRNWAGLVPQKVNVSTTEGYHHPKIVVTDNNIRYIVWLVDKDLNNLSDDIYYSFSKDGENWSELKSITNNMGEFIVEEYVEPDRNGNIHVIWRRWVRGAGGMVEAKYYYAIINEDSCSDYEVIPNMYYWKGSRSVNLIIDEHNREHLFWLEYKDYSDYSGVVIKYMWRDLATKVVAKEDILKDIELSIINQIKVYPNPFNESTTISIKLSSPASLSVSIYNINGQLVTALLSGKYIESKFQLIWNGTDNSGNCLSSGVYYYLIKINNAFDTKEETHIGKFVLLK